MGATSSRSASDRSPKPSRMNRTKRKLSSILLCGLTSNSDSHPSALELESPISSVENLPPASVESISSTGMSSSFFGSEPVCTSSKTSEAEHEESESCDDSAKNAVVRNSINSSDDKASSSSEGQPIQESVSEIYGLDSISTIDTQDIVNEGMPMSSSDSTSTSIMRETHENHDSDESPRQDRSNVVRSADSGTRALLVLSDSFLSLRMFGSGLTTSGSGVFLSDAEPNEISGRILLVDTGSVSPNVFSSGISESNSREARRNSGRLFWDTSSRHNSRRDAEFMELHRWLLDIGGDLHHDGYAHGYSRRHSRVEERRRFRSQMSERRLDGFDELEHQTRFCASGLHREGTCSCGSSLMGEETAPLGSISRVVLLAQALSEVLDEIHNQPLSLSMPMLSLPAPESVVEAFVLKSYKKMDASESGPNYVQQCYICLVDYEEGDKIRVLPCQHEYHAPCVDKWLKEVNGVCPVCRCNVCDTAAAAQTSVSSSELPA